MHILCPHCRNPIELVKLTPEEEILCPSCGSSFRLELGSTKPLQGRRRLGRFELLESVGAGAFGAVYKARDPQLDRIVAIKVPRASNLAEGHDRDRFLREARSVAQLRHPSIVSVHEVGLEDDVPYLVSDFVQGTTLADWLSARRPPPKEAARIVASVADALQYAHGQGVIHRDIKPSNIMLGDDGTPYLMDFGLAKRDAGEITMTLEGQVLGTPAYMSPEQAKGEAHLVDGRSDLYSLGVTLYQLLTGELPFRGTTRMLLHQVVYDEPRPPRGINDRVPRDLETICLTAMAKEPHRRYPTAVEFAADLRRFLHGEPIKARPVSRLEKVWRWCKREPAVAGLTAAFLVSLIAGTAVSIDFAIRATEQAHAALSEQSKTAEALDLANRNLYATHINLARIAYDETNLEKALAHLQRCEQLSDQGSDFRGWEWYYLRNLCSGEAKAFRGHERGARVLGFTPDGRRLRTTSYDALKEWDLATGKETRTMPASESSWTGIVLSPDGKWFTSDIAGGSFRTNESITLRDWDTGKEVMVLDGHSGEVNNVVFGRAGDRQVLFSASRDNTIKVWDLSSARELQTFNGHSAGIHALALSPDGKWIASGTRGTYRADFGPVVELFLWDVSTGKMVATLSGHTDGIDTIDFSPTHRLMASGSLDGLVKIWEVPEGKLIRTLHGHSTEVEAVAFSPDGNLLASADAHGIIKLWNVEKWNESRSYLAHSAAIQNIRFSPDGRFLASGAWDSLVKLWDVSYYQGFRVLDSSHRRILGLYPTKNLSVFRESDGSISCCELLTGLEVQNFFVSHDVNSLGSSPGGRTFFQSGAGVSVVAVSPDGRRLASGSATDKILRIVDTDDGREIAACRGHTHGISGLAFSPDGATLASSSLDGSVRIWDPLLGKELHACVGTRERRNEVYCIAFSPDGELLASGDQDEKVRIWSARSGELLRILNGHSNDVRNVFFLPQSRQLISAGDSTIRIWDADSGAELRVLRGHRGFVRSIALNPDGTRIGSTADDNMLKIWDVAPGLELLSLNPRGARQADQAPEGSKKEQISAVAFSRDGCQVLADYFDGNKQSIRSFDAIPRADERQVEIEAFQLLQRTCDGNMTSRQILDAIESTAIIDERARTRARELAPLFQKALLRTQARQLVRDKFQDLGLRAEVLDRIRHDTSHPAAVREEAMAIASRRAENCEQLNNLSWKKVRVPGGKPHEYELALRQAERACQLRPDNGNYLNTLGVTQCRVGKYKEALETLTRSEKLNAGEDASHPSDLAFIAIAQHHLGRAKEARATLARLREAMKNPEWANDEQCRSFLREAQGLIEGTP